MQAIRIVKHGGPDVLEVVDVPAPEPATGQLLVDVAAVGVNYRDVYEREGVYGGGLPTIIGAEAAGSVAALGEGVSEFAVGDRVAWISGPGSYAAQVAVDAERVVPVPAGVSDELAAAALLQGITAQYLSTSTHAVQPRENVIVHAAAGGVGLLLTQMVAMRGGRVIATTSTEEKAQLAREAGAAEVIPYEQFAARAMKELTGGLGVDVVYDGVGAATFDESLASLRPRGDMVLYGSSSGRVPAVDPMRLENGGSLYLTRPSIRHYTATRQELLERAREIFDLITEGRLRVRIGGHYPLEEARRAHEALEGRRTTGKLVLIPAQDE
jgi:NADPH:quinone reductase